MQNIENDIKKEVATKLHGLGLSDTEINAQLDQLGQVILLSTIKTLIEKKKPLKPFETIEESINYIRDNFSQNEIKEVFLLEIGQISEDYAKSVKL